MTPVAPTAYGVESATDREVEGGGDFVKRLRLLVAAGALAAMVGTAAPALAAAPGAGDTQCKPGQNGNPQPGFKPPPSCPGPNH